MKQTIRILTTIFLICGCILFFGCSNQHASSENGNQYCTLSVDCSEAIKHSEQLSAGLSEYLPEDGKIFQKTNIKVEDGDSVYDILERSLREEGILMEASFTGDSAYVEGIDNLYEFDCGEVSGWTYYVNGESPQVGCSSYKVHDGDRIEWNYSCNFWSDLEENTEGVS